jgi:GAF domain-containing protein
LESLRRIAAEIERDRRTRQLTAVLEIANAVSSGARSEGVLDCVVRSALELTGLDEGIIVVRSTSDSRSSIRASAGSKHSRVGEALVDDGEPANRAIVTGHVEVIVDAREIRSALLRQRGVRCVVAAPIRAGGVTLGALQLASRKANRDITPEDVDTAQLLAGQAALALAMRSNQP